jgi:hypothetical protein
MRLVCRTHLSLYVVWLVSGACATHGVKHTATNEARPHISWEIRAGGDEGNKVVVCRSGDGRSTCVLTASTDRNRSLVTVHLSLYPAARPTNYLGFMRVPFIEGADQQQGSDVSGTVRSDSRPVRATVAGFVTSTPGLYTFSVSVDAMQPAMTEAQHISQQVPVTVR